VYFPIGCQISILAWTLGRTGICRTTFWFKIGNEHKVYRLKKALYRLKQAQQACFF
jgi:hypothetical protein